jgi:hypothetical protein
MICWHTQLTVQRLGLLKKKCLKIFFSLYRISETLKQEIKTIISAVVSENSKKLANQQGDK